MAKLSHHESYVLALIQKWQPTTAYFVRKALGQRLSSSASDSPGSAYPVIERLKRAGLVIAEAGGDARGTERLHCSEAGTAAARAWIAGIDKADLLPDDGWRTRVAFIDQLDGEAASAWFFELREALAQVLDDLEAIRPTAIALPALLELNHARLIAAARLAWVNDSIALMARARVPAESQPA